MHRNSNPFYPSRDAASGLREDQQSFLQSAVVSLGLPSLFYASLRDPRVFETVIGRPPEPGKLETVTIRGFRLGIANAGTGFPGLFSAPEPDDGELECVVVHGLSRFEQTMVAWYEWDEYLLRRVSLTDGRPAQVFVPDLEAIRREYGDFDIEPWSFEAWRARELDRAVRNARDWMAQLPDDASLIRAGCFTPADRPMNGQAAG